ncbi:MAG: type II secretion system F family protein [Acidimicrobiales bacterium]
MPALLVAVGAGALRAAAPLGSLGAVRTRLDHNTAPAHGRPLGVAGPVYTPAPAWIGSALAQAGFNLDAGRVWFCWRVLAVFAVGLGAAGGGITIALVAGGVALAGPALAWRLLRRRGGDRLEAALPGAVDAIARALRSGASLRQALAEAAAATPGPLGDDLLSVAAATEKGASVVAALEAWGERQPTAGVRLVTSALCLGAETGGALARAVDGVAATLRQRLAARAEARALATQARASAAVLVAAPLVFTACASIVDAQTSTFLFRTGAGLLCLVGGLALNAIGALWMARLTRIEVGP